jgi:hypothetical protein
MYVFLFEIKYKRGVLKERARTSVRFAYELFQTYTKYHSGLWRQLTPKGF